MPDSDEENLRKVDDCLLLLADVLYKNTENRLSFKDVLHMRKACVSIAFQMQQLIGATEDYAGVRRWEEAAIDSEEMNEIKDEWVFNRLENQVREISLRHLFWKVILGWKCLIVCAVLFAILLPGVKYAKGCTGIQGGATATE